jgi:adenylate cyclase
MVNPPNGVRRTLAPVLVRLGRLDEARAVVQEFLRLEPSFNLEETKTFAGFQHQAYRDRWVDDLRKAGIPEKPPLSLPDKPSSLPDKPSIAVLPFTNMSGDAEQEYFVDGMTEDLITDLSKLSGLFVIARNSTFAYKGKSVKVRQVAEELGVRYVLEGSVRLVGDKMRINAQLIDATSGGHVWAERYDGGLTDVFDFQDAISREIVAAIKVNLKSAERLRRQATRRPPDAEAYDLVLQGVDLLRRFKLADAHKAKALFEQAIQRDAAYARPHALLALYYLDLWRLWGEGRDKNLRQALKWTEKAIQLDDTDPTSYVIAAYVYQFLREFGASKAEADKALALRPNDAVTLANLGDLLAWAHRPMEAVTMLERAIRLDPFHPPTYLDWLSFAYAMSDRHADCIRVAERGLAFAPDFVGLHVDLAICYASLGQTEEAQRAGREILRTNPRFRISAFAKYVPFSEQADIDRTVAALRQAGLPE